jgi:sensor histidine kinase regulating citrate/malate metabolism
MELLIEKGKKQDWLSNAGGDLAMQLLGDQIDKNYEVATELNLRNKDVSNVEENTVLITSSNTADRVLTTENSEVINTDAVITETPIIEEIITEPVVTEISDVNTSLTQVKSYVLENPEEFINLLFTEVIEPLLKEITDLKIEVETLKKDFIDNKEKAVSSPTIDLEVIPTSSLAALLKSKMTTVNEFGIALNANDPLIGQKPKEFVEDSQPKSAFANFANGF